MTRKLESELLLMCNLSKGIEEKGIKEGVLSSIRNLMESMGWSAEQAMTALKIPETEQISYANELKASIDGKTVTKLPLKYDYKN